MSTTPAPRWTLGERIRKARLDAALDQTQLAQRLGIARQTLSRWESDLTGPRVADLRRLADLTGVPAAWLLGEVTEEAAA